MTVNDYQPLSNLLTAMPCMTLDRTHAVDLSAVIFGAKEL